MGGELSYNKTIQDTLLNNYGVFTFNNSVTKNALADFLIGIPSAVTQDAPVTALWNSWYGAAFIQDDYRISSRMTLNLGLRWDVQTPGTDPQNRFTTYVPGQKSTVRPDAPVGQLFYGDPGVERGVISTAGTTSPRASASCGIRSATARRRSAPRRGLFYGSISGNEWNTMTNFQPWSTRLTFANTRQGRERGRRAAGRDAQQPLQRLPRRHAVPVQRLVRRRRRHLRRGSQDFEWAHAYQTNVGIQRQIFGARSASGAAYIGTFNRNLPFGRDVNYPVVTPPPPQRREHPRAPAEPGVRRGD